MSPLVASILAGVVRHGLTIAGGWLVSQGWLSQDQSVQAIGALVALGGIALSAWEKRQAAQVVTAQAKSISALHAAIQGQSQGAGQ